jgi:DNA-directed RNA polymerase subunit RPC12/RpoP
MATLYCMKCGQKLPLPFHCGQPMHKEKIQNQDKLVCWMGLTCGAQEIPQHCERPMVVKG